MSSIPMAYILLALSSRLVFHLYTVYAVQEPAALWHCAAHRYGVMYAS